MKAPKLTFWSGIKYFFVFVFVAVHVQFVRGTLEVLPLVVPGLATLQDGEIFEKYQKSRRSNGQNYSGHSTISYYVTTAFEKNGQHYKNDDLVSEDLYYALEVGDAATIATLRGVPQVGMLTANQAFGTNNTGTLIGVLLGVDFAIVFLIMYVRRKKKVRRN